MGLPQALRSERCPLCFAHVQRGALEHLQLEHRRTAAEARALLERSAEGTLGWDPITKKQKAALKELSST